MTRGYTPDQRFEIDEYTGEKYRWPAQFTEEARRLWNRYADTAGSSERAFIHVIVPLVAALRSEIAEPSVTAKEWQVLIDAARAEGFIAGKNEALRTRLSATAEKQAGDDCKLHPQYGEPGGPFR